MARVLIVGRGAPERGGIPTFMEMLLSSRLSEDHVLEYLNLGRPRGVQGGRATVGNLRRTARDMAELFGAAGRVDVVHLHSAFAPTVTVLRAAALCAVAKLRGARTIVHLHGGRFPGWVGKPARRWTVRLVARLVDRFAVVSGGGASLLTDLVGASRVAFVPNGVDTAVFAPSGREDEPPVVLYVGVLSPRKGLLELFEASQRLRRDGLDHQLWLVGGVPDEGAAPHRAVREAAPLWTRFLGELAHESLPRLYSRAAVFCLPSWWEAAPLTVLEASASAVPVVASRVGDIPQMVDDDQTGFLVEPHNAEELTVTLGKLLREGDVRTTMGRSGRRLVETRYSLDGTLGALDRFYREAE